VSRAIAAKATLAAAGCVLALSACGSGSDYGVTLELNNAGGLRAGSLVQVGGVPVGKVAELRLQPDDRVRATLRLDAGRGPIGRDARATIASRNLLGEKYVNLTPGDRRAALPSGSLLRADRVQPSVDLDQILDVLTPTTRAKVAVLIDEVGAGLLGRGTDLNAFLRQLPPTLDKATALLDQVVGDNHTLGEVIARSDRFLATLTRQRRRLTDLIDTAGRASQSFAGGRAELTQTLDRAPGTLTELQRTLAEIRDTAPPLRQAARAISASAPALSQTLDAVDPFRRAAVPVLDQLRTASPTITRLGREATPVVKRAEPTLTALRGFSTSLAPVSRTFDVMIDDLMAALHGWSRAIQARDGLSHMFRAKVAVNPESLNSIISRLSTPAAKQQATPAKPTVAGLLPAITHKPPAPKPASPAPPSGTERAPAGQLGQAVGSGISGLLDYLLGK
jgi:phospholipid/cholesterol/gamma-HCH transport system substrate-binding protein